MSSPVLISRQIVVNALADKRLYELVPEFHSLQPKLRTMGVNLTNRSGCRTCRERRVEQNLFTDFLGVVRALNPRALAKLKQYLGADTLMFSVQNDKGAIETRVA